MTSKLPITLGIIATLLILPTTIALLFGILMASFFLLCVLLTVFFILALPEIINEINKGEKHE
jgi:hypothetical protein